MTVSDSHCGHCLKRSCVRTYGEAGLHERRVAVQWSQVCRKQVFGLCLARGFLRRLGRAPRFIARGGVRLIAIAGQDREPDRSEDA